MWEENIPSHSQNEYQTIKFTMRARRLALINVQVCRCVTATSETQSAELISIHPLYLEARFGCTLSL